VFTGCGVKARVGEHQALDRLAADDVRFNDLVHVSFGDVSIPHRFRIDHEIWTVLALIETAGLIGPHFAFESALREFQLE
jgi:hypothetical protein